MPGYRDNCISAMRFIERSSRFRKLWRRNGGASGRRFSWNQLCRLWLRCRLNSAKVKQAQAKRGYSKN